MLIDVNAYIGHWPFRYRRYNTCEALLGRMKDFNVDIAVISQLNAIFYKNTQTANRELYDAIRSRRAYADRFVPFAVINPIYGGWKDDFKICSEQYKMKGIRLYPRYHGYAPDHPACVELVKMARDKGLPVALSLRMVDRRPSSWLDLMDEWALKDLMPIIERVPDASYLILNLANSMALDESAQELLRKGNILMDTSGRALSNLGELLRTYGPEKFAFGTHSPVLDYCTGLLRIESLRDEEADEQAKQAMRSENVRRFLGF